LNRKKERTATLVVQAVLQGFRAIDTACQPKHYREDLVGQALVTLDTQHGINRDDLFIQSKYTAIGGQDRSLPLPYDPSASIAEQVRLSFSTSLKNLQINHLDSYLLHSPLPTPKQTLEAWGVLMALRDEGKCKMIGISNVYDVGVLKMLKDFGRGADVVQNRWYKGNGFDREVLEYCLNEGIRYELSLKL
jgi:diketogulonate reductase-like aldo/keto reductase